MSLLRYFIPVYRWLNITFCLFLILSGSCNPKSIKSVLYFLYLWACIRSKRENKVRLSTRFVAELGMGSVSRHRSSGDHGAKWTRYHRTRGQWLSLCQKDPPAPTRAAASEHKAVSTASPVCIAGPVCIWVAGFACYQVEQRAF